MKPCSLDCTEVTGGLLNRHMIAVLSLLICMELAFCARTRPTCKQYRHHTNLLINFIHFSVLLILVFSLRTIWNRDLSWHQYHYVFLCAQFQMSLGLEIRRNQLARRYYCLLLAVESLLGRSSVAVASTSWREESTYWTPSAVDDVIEQISRRSHLQYINLFNYVYFLW